MTFWFVDYPSGSFGRGGPLIVRAGNHTQAVATARDYLYAGGGDVPREFRAFRLDEIAETLGDKPRVLELDLVPFWAGKH